MPIAKHVTFDRLMPYEVYVYHQISYDKYGEPNYTSQPDGPFRAMVLNRATTVRNTEGLEVTSTTVAYINTDGVRIGSDDKVQLPQEYGGDTRKIAQVTNWPDPEDGALFAVEVDFL
jgi:hypothetical protein